MSEAHALLLPLHPLALARGNSGSTGHARSSRPDPRIASSLPPRPRSGTTRGRRGSHHAIRFQNDDTGAELSGSTPPQPPAQQAFPSQPARLHQHPRTLPLPEEIRSYQHTPVTDGGKTPTFADFLLRKPIVIPRPDSLRRRVPSAHQCSPSRCAQQATPHRSRTEQEPNAIQPYTHVATSSLQDPAAARPASGLCAGVGAEFIRHAWINLLAELRWPEQFRPAICDWWKSEQFEH